MRQKSEIKKKITPLTSLFLCFINIYTHLCSASAGEEIWRMLDDLHKVSNDYTSIKSQIAELDLKVKSFHYSRLTSTVRKKRILRDSSTTELENETNKTMSQVSLGSDLKTSITKSTTITRTHELSGELELPSIGPVAIERIGLKFSRSESTQIINTTEITRKVPSDTVVLEPYSKYTVTSKLFTQEITYTYSVSFELATCEQFSTCSYFSVRKKTLFGLRTVVDVCSMTQFFELYLEKVLQTSTYPVYIRDRKTNETVIEITGPLPEGKVYLRNYPMEIKIEEPLLVSTTRIMSSL